VSTPSHGLRTTTLLVVTSMVGSGVFTTSGILLRELGSPLAVLAVWCVGGLAALAGAWVYAELAVAVRESGGEYALVSRYVHPAAGFVVGLVSFVVGFCAPIAACSFAFARYASAALAADLPDPGEPASVAETVVAGALVVLATLVHAREREATGAPGLGARAQDALTLGKVVLVLGVVVGGALALATSSRPDAALPEALSVAPLEGLSSVSLSALGLGVVLVSFAYTGWNAAAYFAGEIERPERTIPRALAGGTLVVTALYVGLNAVFLASAPRAALEGQIVVGHVAALALFGPWAARALSAVIAFGLLSTVGAFVWTGVRILEAMSRHHPRLAFLGQRPVALGLQLVLSVGLLLGASFDVLLGSVGFALSIASALTVLAVFRVRREQPAGAGFRAPLHPLPALFYLALMVATVASTLVERPSLALVGLATTLVGLVGYAVVTRKIQ
jgi:APA family basic amino acid/polyamine antiporter